jgi:arsenate reductase
MKKNVLFVCVHNAGRSQMASGFLENLGGDLVRVFSAGSQPKNEINPIAVEVMKEVGIDISTRTPKILDDQVIKLCDYVITMGCGDACPVYPGKIYLDWDLADPAGKSLEEVRTIRDDIKDRVISLICEISLG